MKGMRIPAAAAAMIMLAIPARAQVSANFQIEAASSQPTAQTGVSAGFLLEGSTGGSFGGVSTDSLREIAAGILPHRLPDSAGSPFIDTDADGLADGWELYHFGNLSPAPDGDPDGDGHTNAREQLAATHPLLPTSLFRNDSLAKTGSSLHLTWRGRASHAHRIHFSADLTSPWVLVATVATNGGGQGAYTDVDPARTNLARGFYRVEVVRD